MKSAYGLASAVAVKDRPGLRAAVVDADPAAQGVVGVGRRHRAVDLDVGEPVLIVVRIGRRSASVVAVIMLPSLSYV